MHLEEIDLIRAQAFKAMAETAKAEAETKKNSCRNYENSAGASLLPEGHHRNNLGWCYRGLRRNHQAMALSVNASRQSSFQPLAFSGRGRARRLRLGLPNEPMLRKEPHDL